MSAPFKHYDSNGFELCSGREGWGRRKTTNWSEVTCKNCQRTMARQVKLAEEIVSEVIREEKQS